MCPWAGSRWGELAAPCPLSAFQQAPGQLAQPCSPAHQFGRPSRHCIALGRSGHHKCSGWRGNARLGRRRAPTVARTRTTRAGQARWEAHAGASVAGLHTTRCAPELLRQDCGRARLCQPGAVDPGQAPVLVPQMQWVRGQSSGVLRQAGRQARLCQLGALDLGQVPVPVAQLLLHGRLGCLWVHRRPVLQHTQVQG